MTPPVSIAGFVAEGDRVIGYAAPAEGPRPCVLRLEAGGSPIAIVRAVGFSASAAAIGLRLGWCGVVLEGLRLAAAISDTAQVRCHASGRLLFETATVPATGAVSSHLTVADLLARIRRIDMCDDPERLLPFARASLRHGGITALFEGAYATLLNRPPDVAIMARWDAAPPADPARALLLAILTSAEYRDDPVRIMPGPFHPAFAFDLSPLDG